MTTTTSDQTLIDVVLAIADDELIIGHRHSEWTGYAPHIEEDVAFSSIAQDEIGHAAALYRVVAKAVDSDPDALALGREPHEYRNALVCERPNGDWAFTLARHWLYDTADAVRLEALETTSTAELAALVTKIRREEHYHLMHADAWMKRVAHGPVEGRTKLVGAVSEVFEDALGLFEPLEAEDEAVARGLLPVPSAELRRRFVEQVSRSMEELGFPMSVAPRADETAEFVASSSGDLIASASGGGAGSQPGPARAYGGRAGQHSPDFDALWAEMTATYRSDPGATW